MLINILHIIWCLTKLANFADTVWGIRVITSLWPPEGLNGHHKEYSQRIFMRSPREPRSKAKLRSVGYGAFRFSSAQFKILSTRSGKCICAQLRFSEVFPVLVLKEFHCSSDWRWLFLVLSRKVVASSASSSCACLLPAIDGEMGLDLCLQV